jgi:uncharacterized circularly permuted ATP-grasp superfamily protein
VRISEAIEYYHELLSGNHGADSIEYLTQKLQQPLLQVAGRSVCNVLRPYFIDRKTYDFVQHATSLVMNAIATLGDAFMKDPSLRAPMDLSAEEEEMIAIDTGYGAHDVSARIDGFLSNDGDLHFIEYNADSPGGIAFGEVLSEVFAGTPLMTDFAKKYHFSFLRVRENVFQNLIGAYHRWGGQGLPNIAVVDWRTASTYNEFLLSQSYFESKGCAARVADPSELEFRNGQVFIKDFKVDLIYKRLLVGDILTKLGIKHPLVNAVRQKQVCVANGFRVQMMFKKMVFAFLSDPQYSHFFEPEIRVGLARHIPWTRRVIDSATSYGGQKIDLIPFIERERERLVLKPNSEYGGRGVVLGWECDSAKWSDALKNAIDSSYVVQERVAVGREAFPSLIDGKLRFEERYFDLDPYIWNGTRVEGCGVRLSRLALLNVAGGGSATPMFILD